MITPNRIADLWQKAWDDALAEAGFTIGNGDVAHMNQPLHFARLIEAEVASLAVVPQLKVWYGPMPETNGKSNFTAILHSGDMVDGITLDRSEYPDRVRYEADRARYLIGELAERPDILAYDAEKHSGYVAPASPVAPQPAVPQGWEPAIEWLRNNYQDHPNIADLCEAMRAAAVQDAPPDKQARDWTEDFCHENGNYMNTCSTCKQTFMGHKRRITCKVCAVPLSGEAVVRNFCSVCGKATPPGSIHTCTPPQAHDQTTGEKQ